MKWIIITSAYLILINHKYIHLFESYRLAFLIDRYLRTNILIMNLWLHFSPRNILQGKTPFFSAQHKYNLRINTKISAHSSKHLPMHRYLDTKCRCTRFIIAWITDNTFDNSMLLCSTMHLPMQAYNTTVQYHKVNLLLNTGITYSQRHGD